MNLKKFKKSLVSIVLGSSLFLGNGEVICQQPKAWLPDGSIISLFEKYALNPEMIRIILVLQLFSGLRQTPNHNGVLDNIYKFSLLRETCIIKNSKSIKYISSQHQSEKSLRLAFVKAMIVATDQKSYSKENDILKNDGLFKELHIYSQIFKEETMKILRDELDQIFSAEPLADGNDKLKLEVVFKPIVLRLLDQQAPTEPSPSTFCQIDNTPVCDCHTLSLCQLLDHTVCDCHTLNLLTPI